MAIKLSERVGNMLAEVRSLLVPAGSLKAGVLAGAIGLVFSFGMRGVIPARPLGDPLPMILAVTQLTRGFLYLSWRPALFHIFFAILLGGLTVFLLWRLNSGAPLREQATRAGRIAAALNVLIVALLAVDAVMVGVWYLLSGVVSILISGYAAGFFSSYWENRMAPKNQV